MNPEDRVLRALNALKHADQGREAPRCCRRQAARGISSGPEETRERGSVGCSGAGRCRDRCDIIGALAQPSASTSSSSH